MAGQNYPFKNSTVLVSHVQFASNGEWENVQTVHFGNFQELNDLSSWLDQAPRDVAAEILFEDDRGELIGFFGIRTNDIKGPQRTLAWMKFVMSALKAKKVFFPDLIENCLQELGFPPSIPSSELTFEMGIFNYWNTADPLLLGSSPLDEIDRLQKDNKLPAWFSDGHEAQICLEYVWYDPTHIWISQVVSDKRDGKHYKNLKEVKQLVSS